MTEWKARVFWSEVATRPAGGGWEILLDGRPVHTPGKVPLIVPTRALAEAIAGEWAAQEGAIAPRHMPLTRFANSAIETVAPNHAGVVQVCTDYAETDLLCYRAAAPAGLAARQAELWDPLLDWAAQALGARLCPVTGVMFEAQDQLALDRLRARVAAFAPFPLAGFHNLVTLSGSLILGFAVALRARSPEDAFEVSRLDEDWQIAEWGADEEAAALAADKRAAFLDAARFFRLSSGPADAAP